MRRWLRRRPIRPNPTMPISICRPPSADLLLLLSGENGNGNATSFDGSGEDGPGARVERHERGEERRARLHRVGGIDMECECEVEAEFVCGDREQASGRIEIGRAS